MQEIPRNFRIFIFLIFIYPNEYHSLWNQYYTCNKHKKTQVKLKTWTYNILCKGDEPVAHNVTEYSANKEKLARWVTKAGSNMLLLKSNWLHYHSLSPFLPGNSTLPSLSVVFVVNMKGILLKQELLLQQTTSFSMACRHNALGAFFPEKMVSTTDFQSHDKLRKTNKKKGNSELFLPFFLKIKIQQGEMVKLWKFKENKFPSQYQSLWRSSFPPIKRSCLTNKPKLSYSIQLITH